MQDFVLPREPGTRGNKNTFLPKHLEVSDILFIFAVEN